MPSPLTRSRASSPEAGEDFVEGRSGKVHHGVGRRVPVGQDATCPLGADEIDEQKLGRAPPDLQPEE